MNLTKLNLVLALIFSFTFAFAQSSVGVKIGGQLASWSVDPEIRSNINHLKIKTGFQFGAIFEIGLSDLIAIQSEFLYIQKGGVKYTFTDRIISTRIDLHENGTEIKNKISFNYLELPVLLKLKFGYLDETSFFLTVGPSFGYGINGKSKLKFISNESTELRTNNFKFKELDNLNQFEISAVFGAGVGLPLTFGKLTFETRYLIGLSKFQNIDGSNKNRGLGISLGYMIPVSCKKKE